jgi:hypothetical protein
MARQLTIPGDPTGLGALVAGVRSAAKPGAENEFDRAVRAALTGVDGAIVERLLRNYESIDRRVRRRVLGEMDDASFIPARLSAPAVAGPAPRGTTALFDTISRTELEGPQEALEDPNAPRGERVNWYRIQYNGFHCDAERGDPGWSDEVYLITTASTIAPNGKPVVVAEQHPQGSSEYSNVDVGDTRLGPIATCWQGIPPVALTAAAYEHDYGDPNYYKDEIRAAVLVGLAYAAWRTGFIDNPNELTDYKRILVLTTMAEIIATGLNWFLDTDDDPVGSPRTIVLTVENLERFGRPNRPRRPYHYHEWVIPFQEDTWLERTDLQYDIRTRHSGGGGRYAFGYQIERDPPFPPRDPDVD